MNRAVQAGAVPERIERHFERQRESGLTIAAYCRTHGVSAWSFYTWRKRYGAAKSRQDGGVLSGASGRAQSRVTFVELPAAAACAAGYELSVRGGYVLRFAPGASVREVAELARALAQVAV